jgi:hypothetical protein
VRKYKKAVFFGVVLVLTLSLFEGVSFVAGKLLQWRSAMWRPAGDAKSASSPISYEEYLTRRDPVLGWPYPVQYGADLAVNGAQRNAHFPNGPKTGSCVSLYGDSFTQGGDTSALEKNWGNVLSGRLACYVANFGMAGYGTDQAYLRFAENRSDSSPIVILGVHTENVIRNLTRNRDLVSYERWYALKPRFVLNERRELELVPMPALSESEYLRVLRVAGDPLPLPHENFQPGGPAGVVNLEFPYTVSVARNVVSFYGFRARLLRRPEWMEFLQRGHRLHGLEITAGITRKFVELAEQRGKSPLVVILPHPLDFRHFREKGSWPYRNLLEEYARTSIPVIDFGPYLLAIAAERGRPVDQYFGPSMHYNDEGNALVAAFVHARLASTISPRGGEPLIKAGG